MVVEFHRHSDPLLQQLFADYQKIQANIRTALTNFTLDHVNLGGAEPLIKEICREIAAHNETIDKIISTEPDNFRTPRLEALKFQTPILKNTGELSKQETVNFLNGLLGMSTNENVSFYGLLANRLFSIRQTPEASSSEDLNKPSTDTDKKFYK